MKTTADAFSREEPIPGYRTAELIGRGGFGEVWKAVAPGGVAKAIKLVFGEDPSRSESELRSLNRIKDVRHPLILSIDRIEVVKGTLVIVTELGDCNLKEYWQRFRSQGQMGIPQQEILRFIRDAAEALDFIYAEHSLQHLDVKPENFLVFGKHVKMADFGVVKHIYERSASLVHGLTPIYAAPELFEGKANRYTDQYSLAIVYQEMLTGQLPFDGIAPARLATQHLLEPPNLLPLPKRQQPIIARALSKDPDQRFQTCVEFVEELEQASRKSEPVSESHGGAGRAESSSPVLPRIQKPAPQSVPQPNCDTNAQAPRPIDAVFDAVADDEEALPPTILVGIGGTAAVAMHQLRIRINERLGHLRDAPSLKLMVIDSDVQQLNKINRDEDVWKEIETVAMPLRKSEDYRAQHARLKQWIDRRWLYNIPRDQSTDGIRPLGRLALVTNFPRVIAAIDKAIEECRSAESAAQSRRSLDLRFRQGRPRIILMASLSGGTGGGALFDVAYAIRGRLKQLGYERDEVEAVLLHSTPRKGRDKAIANAHATLQELAHYSQRGSYYPGDAQLQIEAFHGDNQTFSHVEFFPLGDNLDEADWKDAADNAAEHLYCKMLREPQGATARQEDRLSGQSIAIQQLGSANRQFIRDYASQICLEMLDAWRGGEVQDGDTVSLTQPTLMLNQLVTTNAAKNRRLSAALEEKVRGLDLNLPSLTDKTRAFMLQELGESTQSYIESLIESLQNMDTGDESNLAESCLSLLDKALSPEDADEFDGEPTNTIYQLLAARSVSFGNKLAAELRDWLQDLVNDADARLDGAQFAAEKLHVIIQDDISAVARERSDTRERIDHLKLSLKNDQEPLEKRAGWKPFRTNRRRKLKSQLLEYGNAKIHDIFLALVHKQLRIIEAQVGATIDRTQRLSHDVTRLSRKFRAKPAEASAALNFDESVAWYVQTVRESLLGMRAEIVRNLEGVIEKTLSSLGYTLKTFLNNRLDIGEVLYLTMTEHARDVVARAVAAIHCRMINEATEDGSLFGLPQLIQNLISQQSPGEALQESAVSVMIPDSADAEKLRNQLGELEMPVSVANLKTNGISILRQIKNVPIREWSRGLTKGAPIFDELAKRLHSRSDVEWSARDLDASASESRLAKLSGDLSVEKTAPLNG